MLPNSTWPASGWIAHRTMVHGTEWTHWAYKAIKSGGISIASTMRECHLIPPRSPATELHCRRRLDIANERLPEFSNLPASYPSVAVPSMRRAQRPRGSGDTTPTGDGDFTPEVSPVAGADVPGGWPVIPREELNRPSRVEESRVEESRVEEGNENPGLTERVVERIAHGRKGAGRGRGKKRS
jgi:hypothetical protein